MSFSDCPKLVQPEIPLNILHLGINTLNHELIFIDTEDFFLVHIDHQESLSVITMRQTVYRSSLRPEFVFMSPNHQCLCQSSLSGLVLSPVGGK